MAVGFQGKGLHSGILADDVLVELVDDLRDAMVSEVKRTQSAAAWNLVFASARRVDVVRGEESLPGRLRAPPPGWITRADVVVVGSGIAGLTAALHLREQGLHVTVVTKVNIDTDGRLVWTRVHREFFRDKPAEFDFRPPGKIFIAEYAKFIDPKLQRRSSECT